ncbi:glutamine-dependent NAD(+) synthetase with GAT domain-containing protein [Dothidotthia symphoricarpi CBS 119687]|uniref:Glutamine-dependent NAD(+) synthetase n=1 Tax=Dothidotthia symphoricarpi CBS 119687 TaxID=1392245 RepID=A0A6A6AG72_9PLEO|nr:glutamine-dependent NAD(+) synthetase with GAT domain-containing protein [Dothidotthia symphoricarpi CBS 119687]KAF2130566.1 glutamine-dependent NAD(+) synthetase with GAT domain-containing protein [Dothidotthia symphoricarpi CBS 119687]
MKLITVATCSLNQWALDFIGNKNRIVESIHIAKSKGATLRVGPELELSGYGCLDHFLEMETINNSWAMLAEILLDESCHGILIDIGMPLLHRGNRYNARVIALNGKILLMRPKIWLANSGNYREMRYFIPWSRPHHVEEYELRELPEACIKLQGSTTVPIGDGIISALDCTIGAETCEELFTPQSPHLSMSLAGTEIICNSSGSHHELRKLDTRISLIQEATRKCGGIYLYANQQGCDGDRLYYDGCAMILVNGNIVAQGSQFSLQDVEVVTATVDLEEVWAYRCAPSRGSQVAVTPEYQRFKADFRLGNPSDDFDPSIVPSQSRPLKIHVPEEEIALGPACWLWDYLRRSGAAGFLIPLSGGLDSCSTATLVYSMCREVCKAISQDNKQVIADVQRIAGPYHEQGWLPKDAQELANSLFSSVYLGMKEQSSFETRDRAQRLSQAIGSHHLDLDIDNAFHSVTGIVTKATNFEPSFDGSATEDLALQNIQARLRLVHAYTFAQLIPTIRQRPGGGGLLVLGSGNVDECLRGYLTKYDCSSADINPIGSISKVDLKRFLRWSQTKFDLEILGEFLDATPTAELRPIKEDYSQSDEADMGMTYAELSVFGRLRKEEKLGPYGMWSRLCHVWKDSLSPRDVAVKVKRFHHFYAINRHKMTTMTPAYHAEAYSPDDNRFDLRPFLYPPFYQSWSFKKIDEAVDKIEQKAKK